MDLLRVANDHRHLLRAQPRARRPQRVRAARCSPLVFQYLSVLSTRAIAIQLQLRVQLLVLVLGRVWRSLRSLLLLHIRTLIRCPDSCAGPGPHTSVTLILEYRCSSRPSSARFAAFALHTRILR